MSQERKIWMIMKKKEDWKFKTNARHKKENLKKGKKPYRRININSDRKILTKERKRFLN